MVGDLSIPSEISVLRQDARGTSTYTPRGLTPRQLAPRVATPGGMSVQGLQMEVLSLKRELATEKEARQAAAGRALTSADEAAAAVSLTLCRANDVGLCRAKMWCNAECSNPR